MSTLVLTDDSHGSGRLSRLFRPAAELFTGIRLARAMAHRYDVLAALSDVELGVRGIKREDIPSLVVNGKYDL